MLRESGPAGNWTHNLSIASPTPYRSASTKQQQIRSTIVCEIAVSVCDYVGQECCWKLDKPSLEVAPTSFYAKNSTGNR